MAKNPCFVISKDEIAFGIKLFQDKRKKFTVVYGFQTDKDLSYSDACAKLGQAILHALACDGKIDNQ